ncbi:MAG: VCBS repeat-containing protein [Planctomycetes bacterium]|nr:VCBS repeat-containing protein [Planctomycetota bacterium]
MPRIHGLGQALGFALLSGVGTAREGVAQDAPRLPIFFVECRAAHGAELELEDPRFVGRAGAFQARFHADHIALRRRRAGEEAQVALRFVAATKTMPVSEERLPGELHSFVGEPSAWKAKLPLHAAIRYRELWPGIDLVAHGRAGELQYDLHLAPHAELANVAMRVEGAEAIRLDARGALVLETRVGELLQEPPLSWEVASDGSRVVVPSRFALRADGSFGFSVERRDTSRPLVVDPILLWGSFFGGSGQDGVAGLVVDASGHMIVAGTTEGLDFVTPGALRSSMEGGSEGFVAKLDPTQVGAAQLLWCTLLGGDAADVVHGLGLRSSGSILISGATPGSFPTTANAFATSGDGFLAELSADGASLVYGSRLPGPVRRIALDASGAVLLGVGNATAAYPTTAGAFQTAHGGWNDLWFARFDLGASGAAQLLWATYFGGTNYESLADLIPSSTEPGVFTFAGDTGDNFSCPQTVFSGQPGQGDLVLGRFDATASGAAQLRFAHVHGTYSGVQDYMGGIALSPTGSIWMSAMSQEARLLEFSADGASVLQEWSWAPSPSVLTESDLHRAADGTFVLIGSVAGGGFPTTADAIQAAPQGSSDLFVARLDSSAQAVRFATYVGHAGADVYLAGCSALRGTELSLAATTRSSGIPIANAYRSTHAGAETEPYLARLDVPTGLVTPGVGPRDVELLDLDGDGDLDAATANETSSNVSLRLNDGQGALSSEETFELTAGDSAPIALARCDLDNDGARDDLAVACEGSDTVVLVTDPSSASRVRSSLAISGTRASSVTCGDLDANPVDDVVVGREGLPFVGGSGIGVSLNGAAFSNVLIPAPHPTQVVKVALGDLDGDGDLDLAAVARGGSDELLLFAGDGSGALAFAGALALSSSGLASGLSLSDLDRDGRSDLCVVQPVLFPPSQTLRVYRRTSSGALSSSLFAAAVDISTSGTLAIDLATGDLEQDSISGFLSRVDLAQANAGDGSVMLRHGFTGTSFVSSTSPSAGTNPVAVAIGDLNGDGCDDLVVANQGSSDLSVVLTTAPALAQSYGAGCGGPVLAGVGSPTLGNPAFGVQVSSARAIAPAIFFYGLEPASVPLPSSACSVLFGSSLGSLLAFTSSSGGATLHFSVPNDPFLRGADLFFQCAIFRSPGGAFSGTLDLSNGLRLQVGA